MAASATCSGANGRSSPVSLGFAIASAIGGAAQNFDVLVAARALQGVFGALLAPAALSLLTTTFPAGKDRARAFGIFGAIAGAGGAIGLMLGGVLTEYLSWRFAMYVNLVFAIPAAAGAIAFVAHAPHPVRPRIDLPGVLSASGGLFSVVYGLSHADTTSWGNPVTVAFLAAGVLLLAVFVAIQRRAAHPLLPLRVVLDRRRGGSYVAFAVAAAGMFGVFLFLTYYLQQTLGYSPVRTGLAFLPMIAVVMATATIATARLAPRFGSRPLVPTGMLLAALGMLFLTRLGLHSTYAADVLPALLPLGRRTRPDLRPLDERCDGGRREQRRRRRVGHGQHVAADRRRGGDGAPEHPLRLVDRRLSGHTRHRHARAGLGRGQRLRHRVRLGGGHLRRRRHPDGRDPAERRAGFGCGAGAGAGALVRALKVPALELDPRGRLRPAPSAFSRA